MRLPTQIASQSNGGSRSVLSTVCKKFSNTGQFGVSFSQEELMRNLFKDPMMVKNTNYEVKIILKDVSQPFVYGQVLAKLDAKDTNPLVNLTRAQKCTNTGTIFRVDVASDRAFWIMDKDDQLMLDVRMDSLFGTVEGVVQVTTRSRLEIDNLTTI